MLSVAVVCLILYTQHYHGHLSHDNLAGIQKYHKTPIPRIGGLAIYLSFTLMVLGGKLFHVHDSYSTNLLMSSFVVFFTGFLEDVTKKLSPMIRMLGFALGAFIAIYITKSSRVVLSLDFAYLDHLVSHYHIIGIFLSLLGLIGVTNAYNVIDGYNGLSATTAIINFMGLGLLAVFIADLTLIRTIIYLIGAILGFYLFNYPRGKIFLGDGGAYFLGFTMAAMGIYLVEAHHGMVHISPYAPLLLNIYPVTEIGFSIYRRKFIHRTGAMICDNFHLHQLVYHRCLRRQSGHRNALVMPLMLPFILPPVILALLFYTSTWLCLLGIVFYVVFYTVSYFSLLRFKTFSFLKILL